MINPKMNGPCKGCTKRTTSPNCHDPKICEEWAKHLEARDQYYKMCEEFKRKNAQFIGYMREDKDKRERKNRFKR